MPTRVLLLRHAETANPLIFHAELIWSERPGRRQAEVVAPLLAAESPRLWCSSAIVRGAGYGDADRASSRRGAADRAGFARAAVSALSAAHQRSRARVCGRTR